MDKENFFERVYNVVRLVPVGRITTYGAIANYLGTKGSSRMVGYAMNSAGTAYPQVPAHRVVNRIGILTGKHYFGTQTLMQQLLESENIQVEDDKIIDFKTLFWDPATELPVGNP